MDTRLGSVKTGFLAATAAILVAGAATSSLAADDNVIESFGVARHGDLLMVPVAVGGRTVSFIVDTGAAYNLFDVSLAPALKPIGSANVANDVIGSGGSKLYRSPGATLGRSKMSLSGSAVSGDMQPLRESTGYDIRGSLGMEFLSQRVVRIDFDAGRLHILKSAANVPGQAIPLDFETGLIPAVKVQLPGIGAKTFRIDTGPVTFTNGDLNRSIIDELVRARQVTVDETVTKNGIGGQPARIDLNLTVARLSLGPFEHQGQLFSEGQRNVLALGYLSRYTVTFDFPNRVLYLEPGKLFERRFRPLGILWVLRNVEGGFEVLNADSSGLAYLAEIRKGDHLLAVNGYPTREMTLFELRTLLGELVDQDKNIDLTIKAASDATEKRVSLRKSESRSAKVRK